MNCCTLSWSCVLPWEWDKLECTGAGLQHSHEGKWRSKSWSCYSCDQWQDSRKWCGLSWGRFRSDIRKMFFTQRMVGHGPDSPGKWSQHQQFNKCVWTMLLGTGCDCWGVLCRTRGWTWGSWWIPSKSAYFMVLWIKGSRGRTAILVTVL